MNVVSISSGCFSSESVCEGQPERTGWADSDRVLEGVLERDPRARVA
ncbi:MAG: hypothetical protein EBT08_13270 [Betaproteobacteria bacterium]|nr:hypothetical protein [Betaproteobacteria bacterium]